MPKMVNFFYAAVRQSDMNRPNFGFGCKKPGKLTHTGDVAQFSGCYAAISVRRDEACRISISRILRLDDADLSR
jgi:hypothetical protein